VTTNQDATAPSDSSQVAMPIGAIDTFEDGDNVLAVYFGAEQSAIFRTLIQPADPRGGFSPSVRVAKDEAVVLIAAICKATGLPAPVFPGPDAGAKP
jgi:hypothetical protein